jgi:hypothetical protein
MNDRRDKKSRTPQFDGLESRALLSATRPTLPRAALPPAMVGVQTPTTNTQVTPGRQQVRLLQNGGNNGGGLDQQLGLTNVRNRFRNRGDGRVVYELNFDSGGYRFRQKYELDVDRLRGDDRGQAGAGLTMVDAIDLFIASLQDRLTSPTGGGDDGNGDGEGASGLREEYRNEGDGEVEFEQEYDSGGYNFDNEYSLDIDRVRGGNRSRNGNGNGPVGLTAFEAVDLFLTTLQQRATGGFGNGGGLSGLRR